MNTEREGPYRYTIVRNGHSAVGVVTMYSKKTCASPIPDALPYDCKGEYLISFYGSWKVL